MKADKPKGRLFIILFILILLIIVLLSSIIDNLNDKFFLTLDEKDGTGTRDFNFKKYDEYFDLEIVFGDNIEIKGKAKSREGTNFIVKLIIKIDEDSNEINLQQDLENENGFKIEYIEEMFWGDLGKKNIDYENSSGQIKIKNIGYGKRSITGDFNIKLKFLNSNETRELIGDFDVSEYMPIWISYSSFSIIVLVIIIIIYFKRKKVNVTSSEK